MEVQVSFAKSKVSVVEYGGKEIEVMNLPGTAALLVHYALNPSGTNDNGYKATGVLKELVEDKLDFDSVFLLATLNDQACVNQLLEAAEEGFRLKFEEAKRMGKVKKAN